MHSNPDPARLSYEQLRELVRQLIAENERLRYTLTINRRAGTLPP